MSDLHQIPRNGTGEPRADVIFVHGLGGDPFATWWHDSGSPKNSWPFWLAEEVPEVQVHCLEYEAAPATWLGPSLPLVERAQNILAVILGKGIGKRPIVFVCHSLGGLVIKQMLRKAQDENIDAWRQLAGQIKAVVFLGTPHRGAKLADTLFRLGKYLGASPSGWDLQTHNGLLKDLNEWFAGRAGGLGVQTHCFYETQPASIGSLIVEIDSGDMGVPGIPRYSVDADHGAICKPEHRDHFLCGYLASVVREAMGAIVVPRQLPEDPPHFVGREEDLQRLLIAIEDRRNSSIVAISGMGGVGKSAFAVHAAHLLQMKTPNGQIYVELGGISDSSLTALEAMTAVLKAFKAETPRNERSAIEVYRNILADKRVLLLLDNARDASSVAPLVEQLPKGCLLIITSREMMPFPKVTMISLEELRPDQAYVLIRDLLGSHRASDDELRSLANRCGYLPLALHAAVGYLARQPMLKLATYLDALSKERERFKALNVKGLPSLDVATVLSFSIRHLQEDNPKLADRWRQLAVFPSSFDIEAAGSVWEVSATEAELDLHELVSRSMVRFEPTSKRYSLHDLLRELAQIALEGEEQVTIDKRSEEASARHARHYCGVLAQAGERFLSGLEGHRTGLALFDLEEANIRAGYAWAVMRMNQNA
jgi:pimeloyl-ACP methyl ester carboxylesterase